MATQQMESSLQGSVKHRVKYESLSAQGKALSVIPLEELSQKALAAAAATDNASESDLFRDHLLKELVRWFKHDFFKWVDAPDCDMCGAKGKDKCKGIGGAPPTVIEASFGAGRVEVFNCSDCNAIVRFPRYNDPVKLLETRSGRCGEWANCFCLCARAMGFEVRYVRDWTDHVWAEVYSDALSRWRHVDPCENSIDAPLTYEAGWGKKLSFVIAFGRDEVVDVGPRYSRKWKEVSARRNETVSTDWMLGAIDRMDRLALESNARTVKAIHGTTAHDTFVRSETRLTRRLAEQDELKACRDSSSASGGASLNEAEQQGRQSGSLEWREGRGETGEGTGGGAAAVNEKVLRSGVVDVGSVGDGSPGTSNTKRVRVNVEGVGKKEGVRIEAMQLKAQGDGGYGDTFTFNVECVNETGFDLVVTRTDAPHGWGQNLRAQWRAVGTL